MMIQKISDSELSETLVERLPLRPASESKYRSAPMTGEEIRAWFDKSSKLLCARLNDLIEFLTEVKSGSGIANLPYSDALTLKGTLEELGALIGETQKELQTTNQRMAMLEVKTYGDLEGFKLRIEDSVVSVKESAAKAEQNAENAKADAEEAKADAEDAKEATEAFRLSLERSDALVEETQLEVANLSKDLDALEKAHRATAARAENSVLMSDKQGLYAHDYDEATGTLVERIMKYSPYSSQTDRSAWTLTQRDRDGCLQAQPPKEDYQLTPKFYVEEHFRPRMRKETVAVSGRTEVTDWTLGEICEFGNGGEPTVAEDQKTFNADGLFLDGEEVHFYCEQPGAFITDIFHGQETFSYDPASGLFHLAYTQKVFERPDTHLTSCRINAPLDAKVYYDCWTTKDPNLFTLQPNRDYTLSGSGHKQFAFRTPSLYGAWADGCVNLHFSSNAARVSFACDAPIYFYGDFCENGQLKQVGGLRYNLSFGYDGACMLCTVCAYPLPTAEASV